MAILHMDGFDGYSSAADLNLYYSGSGIGFNTSGGRFGGGALALNSGGYQMIIPITPPAEHWIGFSFYAGATGANGVLMMWRSASGVEARLEYTPNSGTIQFWRGNESVLFGLFAGVTANAWHWIDIHYKANASGVAEVWVDGVRVINYSGQTYQASTTLTYITVGDNSIAGVSGGFIDDLVIVDTTGSANNGKIGDSKIETLRPTSDAGTNDGTPSTGGTHYGVVDDTTWDATDYLTITNTSAQEELFGMADLSSTPASIAGIQVVHYSKKSDAGTANLQAMIVSSATELDGASTPMAPSFTRYASIIETDPHTSAAWTGAAINALQVGVKVP